MYIAREVVGPGSIYGSERQGLPCVYLYPMASQELCRTAFMEKSLWNMESGCRMGRR